MKKTILASLLIIFFTTLNAQRSIVVEASIDSTTLYIGEQAKYSVNAIVDKGVQIRLPLIGDTLVSGVEVVERSNIDTIELENNKIKLRQEYTITSFDSAFYYLPEQPFVTSDDTIWTNSLSLKVISFAVDTTELAITDIKPVYNPPFNWKFFFKMVALALLLIGIAVGAYYLYKKYYKKKGKEEAVNPELLIPANIIALGKLEVLRTSKLWQQGKYKEYFSELTDILKAYIERAYETNAPEQTTDELLGILKNSVEKDALKDLRNILSTADLVKFAKHTPLPGDCDNCLSNSVEFINRTESKKETDNNQQKTEQ